ncbi:MAG: ABC transporter ATP-binding protein [Rhodospirillaceae bacterium]|nr:ABC transporter ATP-binding protein [Rhodospirillaceae bacterium]MBT3767137.1 ABC transporter ATP-binding protein [Rhodospirillales bacterium]MBT5297794.1 ABC transporter ATP-binding protein [Rhodospirillaceae bacterium]MBT5513207.1 ABC transporter ATP-binding protein [Rhodospirillaceae bacterium]MBT6086871.1 ABC transporter ATP-binding protein [Rhodospirillaceae bacterium]
MLRLSNLEASYGAVRALQGVSMDVAEGAVVAVLGANGAGKSTTLKAISGVVKPTAGEIEFDGKRLNGMTPNQIVRLGIAQVPEGRKIFKDLTVAENLRMGAYARSDKAEISKDLDMILELFPRLSERAKQLGGTLSGGEQQMLAIGRGLMARPRLLLLDEPSLGLAPIIIADIFATLRKINEEKRMTMLVVEQNANIALKNSSFGYVLQVGRVAVEGVAGDLRQNKEVIESYMGA